MNRKNRNLKFQERIKNNPVVFAVLLVVSIVVGIGSVTESIDKIANFYDKHFIKNNFHVPAHKDLQQAGIENNPLNQHRIRFERIENLSSSDIEILFSKNIIKPNSNHNNSPSAYEFLSFLQKHNEIYAHGYKETFSDGEQIILDGIHIHKGNCTSENKLAFYEFCGDTPYIYSFDGLDCTWD